MTTRKSSYRRIELRKAWLERKQRASAAKQELRWKRRTAKLGIKAAPEKEEAPEEKIFVPEKPPEEKPTEAPEEKPSEETPPEEKTEVPRALFPE